MNGDGPFGVPKPEQTEDQKGLTMEIPEQSEGEKRIEEQGLQIFSKIKVLSTRQQIESQIENLPCDAIRLLLQFYQCAVGELTRKIYDDKVFNRKRGNGDGKKG